MSEGCVASLVNADSQLITAQIALPDQTVEFYFKLLSPESAEVSLSWSPEAAVAIGIIPAMNCGLPLHIDGVLEPLFHQNIGLVQDLLACWQKNWKKIPVFADLSDKPSDQQPTRKALFFGGGVDSMFSLLRDRGQITDLIYVHGYDVPLEDKELRQSISAYMHKVAGVFGVNLIEVETDLRGLLNIHASWLYGHGPALAAIGYLLGHHFGRISISSTYSYEKLLPNGTHPLLDPLWSISSIEFVHDGAEVPRAEKVVSIARNPDARKLLRVCWIDPQAEMLNCCRCEKCLRTMVALSAVGELHADECFRLPLKPSLIRAIELNEITRDYRLENYELLLASGEEPRLLAAVEQLLEPSWFKRQLSRIKMVNHKRLARRKERRKMAKVKSENVQD